MSYLNCIVVVLVIFAGTEPAIAADSLTVKCRKLTTLILASMGRIHTPSAYTENQGKYKHLVVRASKRHGIDPHLIHSIIKIESAYNPRAVSRKGAQTSLPVLEEVERFIAEHQGELNA